MTQLSLDMPWRERRVVVGFSGGVTSAWCAGWALRTYPRDEVILIFMSAPSSARTESLDRLRAVVTRYRNRHNQACRDGAAPCTCAEVSRGH